MRRTKRKKGPNSGPTLKGVYGAEGWKASGTLLKEILSDLCWVKKEGRPFAAIPEEKKCPLYDRKKGIIARRRGGKEKKKKTKNKKRRKPTPKILQGGTNR